MSEPFWRNLSHAHSVSGGPGYSGRALGEGLRRSDGSRSASSRASVCIDLLESRRRVIDFGGGKSQIELFTTRYLFKSVHPHGSREIWLLLPGLQARQER
jgi:hypothetical protein